MTKVSMDFEAVQANGFTKMVVIELPEGFAESDLDEDLLGAIRDFVTDEKWERAHNERDDFKCFYEPAIERIESDEPPDVRIVLKDGEVFIEANNKPCPASPIKRGSALQFNRRIQPISSFAVPDIMDLSNWSSEQHDRQPSVLGHDPTRNRWDYIVEPLDEPAEGSCLDDMPVDVLLWVTFIHGEFTISTWDRDFAEIFTDIQLARSQVIETENALTRWGVR
jgi:hypothetical protein